jgi:hypothetical protein
MAREEVCGGVGGGVRGARKEIPGMRTRYVS